MYDKFWVLASKTKKIMGVSLIMLLAFSFVSNYFTVQIDIRTVTAAEYIKSSLTNIIFMILSGLIYVPVAGFILECLFDNNKNTAWHYIKQWYLPNTVLGLIFSAVFIAIMAAGISMKQYTSASFFVLILSLICSKFMFYLSIAVNEGLPIIEALKSSWKRVSYIRVLKTLWHCFLTFLPFMIIMFIIIPLFAVAGGNNMPDSVALLFSLAIAVVSLTGAWFSGLTFFVHYWQMLIDEGKIARPAMAEMSESEHSAE